MFYSHMLMLKAIKTFMNNYTGRSLPFPPFKNGDFQLIFARSASAVIPSETSSNGKCGNCDALQLDPARRRAVPSRFNFIANGGFEVAQPIRCRFIAFLLLIGYVTL